MKGKERIDSRMKHQEESRQEEKKKGILYGVSVGPGDPGLLTLKALEKIRCCDLIAVPVSGKQGARRMDAELQNAVRWAVSYQTACKACPEAGKKPVLPLLMPMSRDPEELSEAHREDARLAAEQLHQGKSIAFLTLGDVTIYSTFLYLQKLVEEMGYETELIPGVPSFCAAAARLKTGLGKGKEEIHILPASYEVRRALELPGTKILMKAGKKLPQVKKILKEKRLKACLAVNCGMDGEKLYSSIEEMPEEAGYYSLFLVRKDENGESRSF